MGHVPLFLYSNKPSGSGNAPNGAKRPPTKPHHPFRTVSLMQQANFHLYKTCIDNIYLDLDSCVWCRQVEVRTDK